jgi:lysophospholipase L1-like esterase
MPLEDKIAAALDQGRKKAQDILEQRKLAQARRADALQKNPKKLALKIQAAAPGAPEAALSEFQTAGFLAAAGDSWFDYPLHDVIKLLEDHHGYSIESTAHKGDPIEKMAYTGGQLDDFARKLEKIKARGAVPKAVLVSGGGDDVAGNEFGMLLNNAFSPIAGWDSDVVDGVLNQRILTAYTQMLMAITSLCQGMFGKIIPILLHGYDYPVPDGRGFLGGWPFPGPWLDPGFREKNFEDLPTRISMMVDIMDRFNAMVQSLPAQSGLAHVQYINLRGTLSNRLSDYKDWWANELHPTGKGFEAVTDRFAAALAALP